MKSLRALLVVAIAGAFANHARSQAYFPVFGTSDYEFLHALPAARPDSEVVKAGWELVWADEFDDPDLSQPDSAKWSIYNNAPYGLTQTFFLSQHVKQTNGRMSLECKRGPYTATNFWHNWMGGMVASMDFDFTAGKVDSKAEFLYGYVEVKARVPQGEGYWPAFWLFGHHGNDYRGEIDIFEIYPVGAGADHWGTNIHWYPVSVPAEQTYHSRRDFYLLQDLDLSQDFYIFGCEWTPDSIKFYINDVLVRTVTEPGVEKFNFPMHVKLNNAIVDKAWTTPNPNITTPDANLDIEYVRFYKPKPKLQFPTPLCQTSGHYSIVVNGLYPSATVSFVPKSSSASVVSQSGATAAVTPGIYDVVATYADGWQSTTNVTVKASDVVIPHAPTEFSVHNVWANGSNIKAKFIAPVTYGTHMWLVNESNGSPNDLGALHSMGWGSIFVAQNLAPNRFYTIRHGVYANCMPWAEQRKVIDTNLSDFEIGMPTCHKLGINVKCENSAILTGGSFSLYEIYRASGPNSIVPDPQFPTAIQSAHGTSITFHALQKGVWYFVKHGVYGQVGPWMETRTPFYAPDFPLNASFSAPVASAATVVQGPVIQTQFRVSANSQPTAWGASIFHRWDLFVSNAQGDLLTPIVGPLWTPNFDHSFGLNGYAAGTTVHLLLRHGVWGNCSNWREYRELITLEVGGTASSGGSGESSD